jgi:glycosyltransferase involved in cell wall biosynthesis
MATAQRDALSPVYRQPTPAAARSVGIPQSFRVVVIDSELPYPPDSGKRIRTVNLMSRLARRHQLTFVCHRNRDADECKRAAEYLADHGISSVVVDRAIPAKCGLSFCARLGINLLSRLPYSVATHTSRQLRNALRTWAAHYPADLWQCEGTVNSHVLRSVPGPRIIHTQNVESSIWQRYFESEPDPLRRWYIKIQWRRFQRFERETLRNAHRVIAVSDLDADAFQRDYGVRRVDVVENGVDTAYFRPLTNRRRQPDQLLFLGSLDWRPNLDAIDQLLERVFPEVRANEPTARLAIVGRRPSAALRAKVLQQPGVELHADVADVRPYLASAGLLVVPLRIAGGSRIKILEALASELPVIATRIGAEGLSLIPSDHLTVVDAVSDLIPAIVQGIRQPARMANQALRGRRAVVANYDWDAMAERLDRVWADCLAGSWTKS